MHCSEAFESKWRSAAVQKRATNPATRLTYHEEAGGRGLFLMAVSCYAVPLSFPSSSMELAAPQADVPMGYPWPASRLTRADMITLCELRKTARRPLTKLLHEAVSAYYELLTKAALTENGEAQSLCCAAPRLEWRGTVQNAAICCVSCGFVLSDDGQL